MKTIPHIHDFISDLPDSVREEIMRLCVVRQVAAGGAVYRQGDASVEIYQVVEGGVKLCNYSLDGREIVAAELLVNAWIGEMGVIDGMPRVSHAIAVKKTTLRVLSKSYFDELYLKYPEISRQLNLMMCRRMRMAYSLREEGSGLTLKQCLARAIHRLSYSHGVKDSQGDLSISISQEELGSMLGVSRQSVNKGLQILAGEGVIELRYGKIKIRSLDGLHEKYEKLMGVEQLAAVYDTDRQGAVRY